LISIIICLKRSISYLCSSLRTLYHCVQNYRSFYIIFNTISSLQHIFTFHTLIFNCYSHSFNNLQSHFLDIVLTHTLIILTPLFLAFKRTISLIQFISFKFWPCYIYIMYHIQFNELIMTIKKHIIISIIILYLIEFSFNAFNLWCCFNSL